MTYRALRSRVGRFEVKPAASRMTTRARRYWFQVLLFQMALSAGKGHRSVRRTHMACRAFGNQSPAAPVTLIAIEFSVFALERPRMIEFLGHSDFGRARHLCLLADDRMTKLAVLSNYFAILADVIPVVAAKTTRV